MTPTAEWYEADADDSDRSITDDVTADSGAIYLNEDRSRLQRADTHETTGETGARVHGDADLLRKRTAALDRVAAENERLRAEVERLHSWQGLLELLDEHWPDDIFPTMADDATRDTGPRLVSALRRAEAAEAKVRDVEALADKWATYTDSPAWQTAGGRLRAVLARSQAPQAPAEVPRCQHPTPYPADDGEPTQPHLTAEAIEEMLDAGGNWIPVCHVHGRGRGVPEDRLRPLTPQAPAEQEGDCGNAADRLTIRECQRRPQGCGCPPAPSVPPATADDEGVRRG